MSKYLDIIYDSERRYYTDYDDLFVKYLIKKFNLSKGKLLDLGCGKQLTMSIFSKKGFEVFGADFSKNPDKSIKESFEIKISNFESENLEYDDNQFDIVLCKSVVEHLSNPSNILKEANRVLKPGGKLIILTPSWKHTGWGPFYIDFSHKTPFTLPSLRDLLLTTDFNFVGIELFYQLPFVWRFPLLKLLCKFIAIFPIPYFPFHLTKKKYNDKLNILIRFSNEPMLLGYATKKI